MGPAYANFDNKTIDPFIDSVFKQTLQSKSNSKKRDYMVVSDLLSSFHDVFVSDRGEEYAINFNHLAMLYSLDQDKDGRYYIDDMQDFAHEIMDNVVE